MDTHDWLPPLANRWELYFGWKRFEAQAFSQHRSPILRQSLSKLHPGHTHTWNQDPNSGLVKIQHIHLHSCVQLLSRTKLRPMCGPVCHAERVKWLFLFQMGNSIPKKKDSLWNIMEKTDFYMYIDRYDHHSNPGHLHRLTYLADY